MTLRDMYGRQKAFKPEKPAQTENHRTWTDVHELQIAEGEAFRRKTEKPENEKRRTEHAMAFNALYAAGLAGTSRCSHCCVFRTGRTADQPCGNCGGLGILKAMHGYGEKADQ